MLIVFMEVYTLEKKEMCLYIYNPTNTLRLKQKMKTCSDFEASKDNAEKCQEF